MQLTYYNNWNDICYQKFMKELAQLGEQKYLDFNQRIIFTKYKMIGIRTDTIRLIAKEISKGDFRSFWKCKFTGIYEELLLRGILLSYINDYDEFCEYLDQFILWIDNWAICDMCIGSYKIVAKNREKFLSKILNYLNSNEEFIVRVGIIFLLSYFLEDEFIDCTLKLINNISYRSYYTDMAIAWLISVAFVKYKDKTLAFLDSNRLNQEIIRLAVQKIRDSKRVSRCDKDYVLKYKEIKSKS